jgi:hypothetical protein
MPQGLAVPTMAKLMRSESELVFHYLIITLSNLLIVFCLQFELSLQFRSSRVSTHHSLYSLSNYHIITLSHGPFIRTLPN